MACWLSGIFGGWFRLAVGGPASSKTGETGAPLPPTDPDGMRPLAHSMVTGAETEIPLDIVEPAQEHGSQPGKILSSPRPDGSEGQGLAKAPFGDLNRS